VPLDIHHHNQEAARHFINSPLNLNHNPYIHPSNSNLSSLTSSNLLALINLVLLAEDMVLLKELLLLWLLLCNNSNKYHNHLLLLPASTLPCHPLT